MHTQNITLPRLLADLDECAPLFHGGPPLWTLTRATRGFEVTVHLSKGHVRVTEATPEVAVAEAIRKVREAVASIAAAA